MQQAEGRIVFKTPSSNPDYALLLPDGYLKVGQDSTETDFELGDLVRCEGVSKDGAMLASGIEKMKNAALDRQIDAFLDANSKPHKVPHLFEDQGLAELEPAVGKTASFAARKILEMAPVKIRFNDDCDGIASGLLVENAVLEFAREKHVPLPHGFVRDRQCNSAVYDVRQADYDCSDARAFSKKSLLFLLDFGANEESVPALEMARQDFDVCIIDHHAFSEKAASLAEAFLSPMTVPHGSSSHTTGLMAFEFAHALAGKADARLAWHSMQSDKSVYRRKEETKEPVVLDYLARDNDSLSAYRKVLADPQAVAFAYAQAQAKLRHAFGKALRETKVIEAGKAKLAVSKLAGIVEKNAWPPKGKVLNEIQKHFEGKDGELLVASVGYDGTNIQFRVSRALHAKGFKSTEVIRELAKDFPLSGGGHEQASAMRFDEDLGSAILEKTIEICKRRIAEAVGHG